MLRTVVALMVILYWGPASIAAQAQEGARSSAPFAYLVDYETGTVLYQKEADARFPPASLAKLMTVAVVLDAIRAGDLSLDDEFTVSENAWRTGGAPSRGSTMFAILGSSIRVEDLLHAVIVQSANDGCIILAEGMAGSESAFAARMNDMAKRLGLHNTQFRNSTGLPHPEQFASARDLAVLAQHIITEFPEFYGIYSKSDFTWNNIFQRNRNPLLNMSMGADGMKTGYTKESGYALVGSAVQNGQRLILVISGLETDKARGEEARSLLEWGFHAFERVTVFNKGDVIGDASVFGGVAGSVSLAVGEKIELLQARSTPTPLRGRVVYDGPVQAPVRAGSHIGMLHITRDDISLKQAPVYAIADIPEGTVSQRALSGLYELVFGWW